MAGVRFPAGRRCILFATSSRPVLVLTQPPVHWLPAALSRRVKRSERETDPSPPSNAEFKNAWGYTSTPNTSSSRGV